ncbi:NAD(P)/FAD-dependent oxidoreductase [Vogesella sp. LIG4]|uniref:NAD(P)/FAD-dependent oxidoreductase n=1 Tax=Vogesella sp. LIG4 TaxID=1192162 RepID=UPI00081F7AEA|nr:FAD-dependent oxidoreductase [Vogesella sp. LIG4]SCK26077.1 Predicted NAD/FAD-binding protein [Vogesella sp. LIG4]
MRIAVVGAGIAGLSAAWLLSRSGHQVVVYEANDYAGGHSNTVDVSLQGVTAPVDAGFLVHNDRTYPNLTRLFRLLGVAVHETEMTFSVALEQPQIEWAGTSLGSLFVQRRNLLRGRFWHMLGDILRLHWLAPRLQLEAHSSGETLGEILDRYRFGQSLRDWYLLPMGAAIWSCSTHGMARFPAATFFDFCLNHGLMQVFDRPQWKTVLGGSRQYVRRMLSSCGQLRLRTPVTRVRRGEAGVHVSSPQGEEHYHQLVLACHSDQALALLSDADADEQGVLRRLPYQRNRALLHTDTSFLPRRPSAWAAWNYRVGSPGVSDKPIMVSYLLNKLQPLPFSQPVIVTLNPYREPPQVLAEFDYAHPVFDTAAIAAQRELALLQGRRHTWFAGAWTGYGFHEDGLKAGMAVARGLHAHVPWQLDLPLQQHEVLPPFAAPEVA